MRRRLAVTVPTTAALVVAATAAVVSLPVVAAPPVRPHAVAPSTSTVAIAPTREAIRGVVAESGARRTKTFTLAGVTWRSGTMPAGAHVEIRVHEARGGWSGWNTLDLPDEGPDDNSRDARAAAASHVTATSPLWVNNADGIDARVVSDAGVPAKTPTDLTAVMVNGGSSTADAVTAPAAPASSADAAAAQPTIYTRAQWGADESLRSRNPGCGTPDYGSTVKMGFLHHTDGTNGYTSSAVPGIIRSIYAYHVESNGWCDIGYNFLVDRFGRIWEGRYGGITRPVIGAHTGGFNADSFGVSMIGAYSSVTPPAAMLTAVEKLFAWRLGAYYRDPTSTTTMTAAAFSGSRFPTGSTVTFKVISGHRDADTTTCPGNAAYAQLPAIRNAVKAYIGAGLVAPVVTPTTIRMSSGQQVGVRSGVLGNQAWKLTVTNAVGSVIRTITGSATPSAPVSSAWDGNDDLGVPAPPGTYTVALSSTSSSSTALPYSTKVTVAPPITISGPAQSGYNRQVTLTGTVPAGTDVTLNLTRAGAALPPQTIHPSSTTWSTTFTADADYTWSATADGYTTPTSGTQVVPLVTAPAPPGGSVFVTRGSGVTVNGTALPSAGARVTVALKPTDGSTATMLPATVAPDGSWSAVVTPTTAATLVVTDGRGLASTPLTVYPVDRATASMPSSGYSARKMTVTGNAGNAPVTVTVTTKAPGASSYATAATVSAAKTGGYSATFTLPTVSSSTSLPWRVSTGYGPDVTGTATVMPTFAPTAAAAGSGHYNVAVVYSGKAVPGDAVTLYTHPYGATSFVAAARGTAAAGTGAFRLTAVLRNDIVWKVVSASGSTPEARIWVGPTISGPASAKRLSAITLSGTGLPGQKLTVYQRFHGTSTRMTVGTVTISSSGYWSIARRLDHSSDFWALSHGHVSRTISVSSR